VALTILIDEYWEVGRRQSGGGGMEAGKCSGGKMKREKSGEENE
jgi:hypothetical protein